MRIELYNTRAKIVDGVGEEFLWASDYLTYTKRYYLAKKKRHTGTKVRLIEADFTFPAGLVSLLIRAAKRNGGPEIEVVDKRVKPVQWDRSATTLLAWLRDDQKDVMRTCYKRERGLLHLPTAWGKTECAVALALVYPTRWAFFVHRTSLLQQTADRFTARTGLPAGVIGAGRWAPEERFTVASLQTLFQGLQRGDKRTQAWLESLRGIVQDEAHCLGADSYRSVVMGTPNAYWRYGLSATALSRGDGKNLLIVGALGEVIHKIKPDACVEQGLVAKPHIKMYELWQDSERLTWEGAYRELIVKSKLRNEMIVKIAGVAPKPCLIFVKEVAHGRSLTRMLEMAGLRAAFVWGAKDTKQRDAAAERLARNDLDVIVASVVWQEGVDIPELRTVIVGCGGKSTIAALQRLGRGMRLADGKDDFYMVDIADVGHKLTERHAKARQRAYKKAGFEIEVFKTGG